MHHVYVLEASDRSWYIGYTQPLRQRLAQHQRGEVRTTRLKSGLKLIYVESYRHKMDALGRERFLKSGAGRALLKKQLRHYLSTLTINQQGN